MPAPTSIVIAAGGTGGHIYPGLALAEALGEARPEALITFLGTPRGLESRLIPEAGFRLELVDMVPFAGKDRHRFPLALARASFQARRVMKQVKAQVAVSMGGYPGIPAVSGARLAGIPSLIHESGAIPGKANLLAARLTDQIGLAFATAAPYFKGRSPRLVGMPLNRAVSHLDREAGRAEARAALGLPPEAFVVFITGGSQGAASLNQAAVGLGQRWRGDPSIRVILKTGRAHHERIEGELSTAGADSVVTPVSFFERITDAYAAADVTISRAGAGSVAELAAVGMPSILVPYPHASDDHQTVNAQALTDPGGAVLVTDDEATADRLGSLIDEWRRDPQTLETMGQQARAAGHPGAASELASWVLDLANVGG